MAIFLGGNQITSIKLGDADVLSVCLGDNIVWSETSPGGVFALKFTNDSDTQQSFSIDHSGSSQFRPALEYSLNGGSTWTAWGWSGDITVGPGEECLVRASSHNSVFSESTDNYVSFNCGNNPWSVEGPLGALLDADPSSATGIPAYGFYSLFASQGFHGNISLEGISSVETYGLTQFVRTSTSLSASDFDDINVVGQEGFHDALVSPTCLKDGKLVMTGLHLSGGALAGFAVSNSSLTEVHLSVEELSNYLGGNRGVFQNSFDRSSNLSVVDLSVNPTGYYGGGAYCFAGTCRRCPNLRYVSIKGLSATQGQEPFLYAFDMGNHICCVEFPDLVNFGSGGGDLHYMFDQSTIREVKFAPGTEQQVRNLNGWDNKWRCTNPGSISVWCGVHLIHPYDNWADNPLSDAALRFIGKKDGAVMRTSKVGDPSVEPSLETSEDGQSWNPYIVGNEIQFTAGQKVYLRASQENEKWSQDNNNYFTIDLSNVNVDGSLKNLMTPLSDGVVAAPDYNFARLFNNVQLSDNAEADISLKGISSYGRESMWRAFMGGSSSRRYFNTINIRTENNISVGKDTFLEFMYGAGYTLSVNGGSKLNLQGLSVNGVDAFYSAFRDCDRLTEVSVGFDSLSGRNVCTHMFSDCENLTKVDVYVTPTYSLTGDAPFENMFRYSSNLRSVKFRGLSTLYDNQLGKPFDIGSSASKLSSIEFPDLVSCQQYGISGDWGSLFNNIDHLSVIRFGHEEVSADILSSEGWDTLWGIPITTQLCVWAGSICLHSPPPPWSPDTYIYKTSDTAVGIPLFTFEGNSGYPEFRAELCGTAGGNCFIGFQDNDDADYRLFNSGGDYWYMDSGRNRASGSGPNIGDKFGLVSAWNCGWQVSTESQTGYKSSTSTTDTLSGVVQVGGSYTSSRFAIGRLSVLENGALTHLYVPINDTTNGAGLSDAVEHTTHFPVTQGVWNYAET